MQLKILIYLNQFMHVVIDTMLDEFRDSSRCQNRFSTASALISRVVVHRTDYQKNQHHITSFHSTGYSGN